MPHLAPASLPPFASAYPASPVRLRHQLADHPLLSLEALAETATALPEAHVERRIAHAVNGGDFAMDGREAPDIGAIVRSIGSSGNWVMLRFVEQLPAYRALLEAMLEELGDAIRPATGRRLGLRGFIFVSAPGTLTPFHFDCEYNVLFQVAGTKSFAVYPATAPWLPADRYEAYVHSGDNMLPWCEDFADQGAVHRLAPGDALYVPHAAPHWVRVDDQPSVSLSITWQSRWSIAAGDAMLVNPLLRRCGLPAAPPPQWPATPRLRAFGGRLARRARLL